MQSSYVPLGAALAICLAAAGCAAPSNDENAAGLVAPPPEVEEDLTLTVDALDVRHGSLRIEASMVEGSPDVSMWLGPTCETREVGRGFATRSGFAWSLSREDIARAIECSLVVRVHTIDDDGRRVRKTATLPVTVSLVPDGADDVRVLRQESAGSSTKIVFAAPSRAKRVHIAGSIIGAEAEDDEAEAEAEVPKGAKNEKTERDAKSLKGMYVSAFVVGNDDLALSTVGRKHLTLLGDQFLATISVGSMTLDVSEPEPEAPAPEVDTKSEPAPDVEPESSGEGYYDDGDYYYGEG